MDDLRKAAQLALKDSPARSLGASGEIERATVEVRIGTETELVTLRLRDTKLAATCTCGAVGCAHIAAALRLLAGSAPGPVFLQDKPHSLVPAPRASLAPVPLAPSQSLAPSALDVHALVEALDELVTAVVRKGVADPSGASVHDTIERLTRALPTPPPLGIARFVGRLRQALEARDVGECAQLMSAATHWVDDTRAGVIDVDARRRASTWLESAQNTDSKERASDRTYLEVARETVHGIERAQIERRYLIDLDTGEALREERLRRAADASIGPCPRLLGVGLAEIADGVPRRVQVLQYAVNAELDRDSWTRLASWATRDFEKLAETHREQLERFAGLYEPFALIAPTALTHGSQTLLVDDTGHAIALHAEDDAGVLRRIAEITGELGDATPAWVAGRLLERHGSLVLRPLALGMLNGEQLRHERL